MSAAKTTNKETRSKESRAVSQSLHGHCPFFLCVYSKPGLHGRPEHYRSQTGGRRLQNARRPGWALSLVFFSAELHLIFPTVWCALRSPSLGVESYLFRRVDGLAMADNDNTPRCAILDGKYFTVISSRDDRVKAACSFCKATICGAYSSTSNFKLHLKVGAEST